MRRSADNASHPEEDTSSLWIETEGRGRIAEISASARRIPWFWNLLQVLWVAGPATFLLRDRLVGRAPDQDNGVPRR